LPDVRCADARSAKIGSPDGVTRCFKVSAYKVEPSKTILARNLLPKDDWRLALTDEVVECGPQVPLVSKPAAFACRGERLARTGSGPHRTALGPSRETEGERPASDPGEEMALSVLGEFCGGDVLNGSFIHNSDW
jgi:hypothetical protein